MLPTAIVLTFPKTGSTSLYATFAKHPDIGLPNSKETWFFNQYWDKGIEWYKDRFAHCTTKKVICDFVSTLMYEEGFTEKLKQVVPDARYIVLLRDPVERCISHYFHEVRRSLESERIETALALEEQRLKSYPQKYSHLAYKNIGSLYKPRIIELIDEFPRNQIHIVLLEEIISSDACFYALWQFLGVKQSITKLARKNVARLPYNRTIEKLLSFPMNAFQSFQGFRILQNTIPKTLKYKTRRVRGGIASALSSLSEVAYKKSENPEIPQSVRNELARYYNNTLNELGEIIGKDLSIFWPWYRD